MNNHRQSSRDIERADSTSVFSRLVRHRWWLDPAFVSLLEFDWQCSVLVRRWRRESFHRLQFDLKATRLGREWETRDQRTFQFFGSIPTWRSRSWIEEKRLIITRPYNAPETETPLHISFESTAVCALIYHGVPGMGLLEIGLALPFTFSSPPIRSDVRETSP